jgi:hypothetical protein
VSSTTGGRSLSARSDQLTTSRLERHGDRADGRGAARHTFGLSSSRHRASARLVLALLAVLGTAAALVVWLSAAARSPQRVWTPDPVVSLDWAQLERDAVLRYEDGSSGVADIFWHNDGSKKVALVLHRERAVPRTLRRLGGRSRVPQPYVQDFGTSKWCIEIDGVLYLQFVRVDEDDPFAVRAFELLLAYHASCLE